VSYTYPTFVAALDDYDIEQLSERAGVSVESIEAIAAGPDVPPEAMVQMRLAGAMGEANPFVLFRLGDAGLQRASTVDVEAQGLPRFAVDDDALRATEAATR
jgi:hypothetical protein